MANEKKDKFIEIYAKMEVPNGSEAARLAGYSPTRAAVTASELLKDPYVMEKLRKVEAIKQSSLTDGDKSVQDIFDDTTAKALNILADKAKVDPSIAKIFLELKLKYDRQKEEKLGGYEGLSTSELILRFNECTKNGQDLINRIKEEQDAAISTETIGSSKTLEQNLDEQTREQGETQNCTTEVVSEQ